MCFDLYFEKRSLRFDCLHALNNQHWEKTTRGHLRPAVAQVSTWSWLVSELMSLIFAYSYIHICFICFSPEECSAGGNGCHQRTSMAVGCLHHCGRSAYCSSRRLLLYVRHPQGKPISTGTDVCCLCVLFVGVVALSASDRRCWWAQVAVCCLRSSCSPAGRYTLCVLLSRQASWC